MGSRANLIITDGETHELFYCHWCGIPLARYLFWGPEHATAFIRRQQPFVDDLWLEVGWAEGGAVLDTRRKRLLLFSDEDLRELVPLRRLYMRLLAAVWEGWDVAWAYFGAVDLVDYIGAPRSFVETTVEFRASEPFPFEPVARGSLPRCVGSLSAGGETTFFLLPANADAYLASGPELVRQCAGHPGHSQLDMAAWHDRFPESGFHLDLDRRQVHYWAAAPERTAMAALPPVWPTWRVRFHRDLYEVHQELAGPALRFNVPGDEELVQEVSAYLLGESINLAESGMMAQIGQAFGNPEGVNPLSLHDARLPIDAARRREILAWALARVLGGAWEDGGEGNDSA